MFSHYGHLEAIFKQWINFVGGLLYCKNKKLAWKDLILYQSTVSAKTL